MGNASGSWSPLPGIVAYLKAAVDFITSLCKYKRALKTFHAQVGKKRSLKVWDVMEHHCKVWPLVDKHLKNLGMLHRVHIKMVF